METKDTTIGLGDVVSLCWASEGYGTGTVCQVNADGTVDVFRPFTHAGDFSCAGTQSGSSQVLCYVGVETVRGMSPKSLKLLRKGGPLR